MDSISKGEYCKKEEENEEELEELHNNNAMTDNILLRGKNNYLKFVVDEMTRDKAKLQIEIAQLGGRLAAVTYKVGALFTFYFL